jgi:hypothetical protein
MDAATFCILAHRIIAGNVAATQPVTAKALLLLLAPQIHSLYSGNSSAS